AEHAVGRARLYRSSRGDGGRWFGPSLKPLGHLVALRLDQGERRHRRITHDGQPAVRAVRSLYCHRATVLLDPLHGRVDVLDVEVRHPVWGDALPTLAHLLNAADVVATLVQHVVGGERTRRTRSR